MPLITPGSLGTRSGDEIPSGPPPPLDLVHPPA